MEQANESKITYLEGNNIRVIRARVIGDENGFFILQRRDGDLRINKARVIKIERGRDSDGV